MKIEFFSQQSQRYLEILKQAEKIRVAIVDGPSLYLDHQLNMPYLANHSVLANLSAVFVEDILFIPAATSVSGYEKHSVRSLLDKWPSHEMEKILGGIQLLNWTELYKYCPLCKKELDISKLEICKICESCEKNYYPSPQPVVIVLIHRKNELLLAKANPPKPFYSCIAGFVEVGETLEKTLIREVKEEVGVNIKSIRYFGSQPWPFPNQLMVGYFAEWESGEIGIDRKELTDAKWFSVDQLPELPAPISIARRMIESFIKDNKKDNA